MSVAPLLYYVKLSENVSIEVRVSPDIRVGQLLTKLADECRLPLTSSPVVLYFQGHKLDESMTVGNVPEKSTMIYTTIKDATHHKKEDVSEQVYRDLLEVNKYYPGLLVNNMPSLYVRVAINGTPVVCVIDTGAEFNSIGIKMARACGLQGHIDTRYAGRAVGIGSTRMIGRVHICQVQCGNTFLPMNFAVLDAVCDTLIGMSALRMYRAKIDLDSFTVTLGGENVALLSSEEIQKYHKEHGT